jgi:S-DNA-T family DNA segregation ATPase FtsK/SpoIIIE
MLYLSPHSHKLIRAQGTLVDDPEIRRIVRYLRDVARPSFERQLVQIRSMDADEERLAESENNSSASLQAAQEDPMFDRAVEIVLETKRGSVSLLQRRLAIGYTRASRLIDLMGIAGIIGEHKGSVAREVMITQAEWDAMKALHERELAKLNAGQGELFAGASDAATETDDQDDELFDLDEEDADIADEVEDVEAEEGDVAEIVDEDDEEDDDDEEEWEEDEEEWEDTVEEEEDEELDQPRHAESGS